MKSEVQQELIKKYPLIFRDYGQSIQTTAISWGLDVGDGWNDLLDELFSKLEPLIQKYIDENPEVNCRTCGDERRFHSGSKTSKPGKCLAIHRYPTKSLMFLRKWWPRGKIGKYLENKLNRIKYFFIEQINKVLLLFYKELTTCWCEKYNPWYPCASQIKEKFGGLRLYMTSGTDEIFDLIEEYEDKSYHICEDCGSDQATQNEVGWVRTLCDPCRAGRTK